MANDVPAHAQEITHRYTIHYPEHLPREADPHYHLFEAAKAHLKQSGKWQCAVGVEHGDTAECSGGLELHHHYVEYALANAVDLALIAAAFPNVTDAASLQTWIESEEQLQVLCAFHHRGHGGVHVLSAADWEAERFVRGLVT